IVSASLHLVRLTIEAVRFIALETVDLGPSAGFSVLAGNPRKTQHVIERSVFQHKHKEMLDWIGHIDITVTFDLSRPLYQWQGLYVYTAEREYAVLLIASGHPDQDKSRFFWCP